MGHEINLLDRYPKSKRPISERGSRVTDREKKLASQFGKDYFDGSRMTGYGGYSYHPRFWTETVKRFKEYYSLAGDARVLDIGCAKGFMMYDFKLLMPGLHIRGIDISGYAVENAKPEIRDLIQVGNAKELPFPDDSFDLVIAINVLHSLPIEDCRLGLREMQRVSGKHAYVMNDAWRTEEERAALMNWNLTGLTFMHVEEWKKLFDEVGYTGDYGWFIAEGDSE
jgi:SAM-dependent methyltransferase